MRPHLTQFARQLARWTEEIINHGRTPFRRVDIFPKIATEQGTLTPPLVFWINRQSMMAGGIVFLPDNNLENELERGKVCASALGLRHFVTWETERVRIWEVGADAITEHQSFPLGNAEDLESFRYLLIDLLDSLKLLAVIGAIPPAEQSHWYLNNLFQITLQQTLPPLVEAYRRQRSETEEHSPEDADTCANEANRLILLQILALLWFDKLPDAILPEKTERAIELSLPELPAPLQRILALSTIITPPPLPLEAAVSFHHLLLRLRQLSWQSSPEKARESILSLKQSWYHPGAGCNSAATTQIYPAAPPLDAAVEVVLSNSLSLLAITALLTAISQYKPKTLLFGTLFQLDHGSLNSKMVAARLLNRNGIPSRKRQEFTTRLRTAWPNRHLKIKTGHPYWTWELTHLLGLCHPDQKLCLDLPAEILTELGRLKIWTLLHQNTTCQKMELIAASTLRFNLKHGDHQAYQSLVVKEGEAKPRKLLLAADPIKARNQLLLALKLPRPVYQLLDCELLWPEQDSRAEHTGPGLEIYRHSRLYQWFCSILGPELSNTFPEPEPVLLKELDNFALSPKATASIDTFLADLLDCPTLIDIIPPEKTTTTKTPRKEGVEKKKLKESLLQQLTTHGIPNFPEQYLYFLDQPEISHHSITPPLELKNSLLGQFEFVDGAGQSITGYGSELEQALFLCSAAEKSEFDLPQDRHQLEEILKLYRDDLNLLYKYLKTLCYSQIENPGVAKKVIKSTWKALSLPDPTWFKS